MIFSLSVLKKGENRDKSFLKIELQNINQKNYQLKTYYKILKLGWWQHLKNRCGVEL